ncbi:hypothetical protein A1O7_05403 [Cladophialophora yegresii CBS 114405]|uniref:DUF8035 domain-containing protein n=1 Tax=Cladophialophora yegresii CBS 114405 TaxID=1182544 RepID=W9VZ47_9EURO|nr:uncharacterized protein A1O7_05403 [Cladophialophora yegresii CBS 114405]EXJ57980.1 hypothetical protein A1O7_05403 [Cladophialophora yegresii CBS 114405]
MSRYRGDPRYSDGNLAYRDPPPQRWDAERFTREREVRAPAPPAPDYPPPRRAPVYEEQRFYEEDRYGPRGASERRYFEETDYYDPRAQRGQMVPYAPERPARPDPIPRPGILRRQSSLDTFDRRPARRFDDYDELHSPRRAPPPRELIPVRAPSPRRYPRYDEKYYDEVRVQDPDHYGDDGFREYREREWVRERKRNSPSPDRRTVREEIIEERKEEVIEEKPYPRRGKTRMPKRLVHTKVLYDLGYPYYEEDERTIIIEKALGPDNIDEVFTKSKEYREREVTTTRLIEAPPPVVVSNPAPSMRAPSVHGGDVVYEKMEKVERIDTVPLADAPRSVRDWDALSVRSPSPKAHRSRSRRRSRRGSSPGEVVRETVVEKKEVIRDVSPARTHRSHATSHRRGSFDSDDATIIERRVTRDEFEDSNSVHVGPLALVVDRKPQRSERNIKEEIRRLEAERRELRRERRYEREGGEVVKIERVRERTPSPRGEVIIERRGEEVLEVKKDRRGRMSLVVK